MDKQRAGTAGRKECSMRSIVVTVSLVLAAVAGMAACSGCSSNGTATQRTSSYFGLTDVSSVDVIRAGLLAKLPVGSTQDQVMAFLKASGIGADDLSSFHPADKDGDIVCRIEYDPRSMGFVKENYVILFQLNDEHKLRNIDVLMGLTGL
jgi:hypothetical protein